MYNDGIVEEIVYWSDINKWSVVKHKLFCEFIRAKVQPLVCLLGLYIYYLLISLNELREQRNSVLNWSHSIERGEPQSSQSHYWITVNVANDQVQQNINSDLTQVVIICHHILWILCHMYWIMFLHFAIKFYTCVLVHIITIFSRTQYTPFLNKFSFKSWGAHLNQWSVRITYFYAT